jgi:hypothetical protein
MYEIIKRICLKYGINESKLRDVERIHIFADTLSCLHENKTKLYQFS